MTPYLEDLDVTVYHGDALETLRSLPQTLGMGFFGGPLFVHTWTCVRCGKRVRTQHG